MIDILTTTFVEAFFWEMCQALSQRYLYFYGDTINDEKGMGGKETNQTVPLEKLERGLNRLGIG